MDDILILCHDGKANDIAKVVSRKFSRIGLSIYDPNKHPEKSTIGKIGNSFGYLGYQFHGPLVTARSGSVDKLKDSLVSSFTSYKHAKIKSKEFLLWRLNLRITGCIFQKKCKGWLFYFSEINDEPLLHKLDWYIAKLIKRFDVDIAPKKFVRAYHQVKHCKHESTYIPNLDNYTIEQMTDVLQKYFNVDTSKYTTSHDIQFQFHKRIDKQVRDLLTDTQGFGS